MVSGTGSSSELSDLFVPSFELVSSKLLSSSDSSSLSSDVAGVLVSEIKQAIKPFSN